MKNVVLPSCLIAAVLSIPSISHADAMLGAYIKSDGWSLSEIDRFNSVTTKPMAVVNLFTNFDYDWGYLKYQSDNIVSRNAIPMISWMPTTKNQSGVNILGQISTGQWDAYIQKWINGFKWFQSSYAADKKPKILLRFGHEFIVKLSGCGAPTIPVSTATMTLPVITQGMLMWIGRESTVITGAVTTVSHAGKALMKPSVHLMSPW